MKRMLSLICVFAAFAGIIAACSSKKESSTESTPEESSALTGKKVLVCYFSATGTTKAAAERLAGMLDADLHEIVPAEPYTDEDLDWRNEDSRSSVEMKDKTSRPEVTDATTDLSGYEVVFIGYPNWWNTHPTIVNTFIEANNFDGKTVAPFMTSGGSTIENSVKELKESYPDMNIAEGMLMNDVSDDDLKVWFTSIGL